MWPQPLGEIVRHPSSLGFATIYRRRGRIANRHSLVSGGATIYRERTFRNSQPGGPMKFGMMMPTLGPLASGPDALEAQRTVALKAEALGFDSLWVPDHVVIPTTIKSRYPY